MLRQALLVLITVALFGVFVPWLKGLGFLDPVVILCYACLGVLYVAPAAAEAFGKKTYPTRSAISREMGILIFYGWGVSILTLAAGILTVNLTNWHGSFVGPRLTLLLAAMVLSAAACAAVIALGAILARAFGPKKAKTVLRLSFLLLLLGLAYGYQHLPEDARFQLELTMTTSGLTRLAYQCSAVLVLVTALLTAWCFSKVRPV